MLNGPSYAELVKDFLVKAKVHDQEATHREEVQKILHDRSLRRKTRKQMALPDF